ncbi:hypothetical protein H5410_002686 [Solanum commersonii]|uniref:Transposase MuDR plant domain-containing protein n=1 Tax=Solanum commersonii TaxID=4109 RepID=A0A9J6B2N9_SOLCO|nr:hypothetical protein H5410_002686 [Solanum commersonii]
MFNDEFDVVDMNNQDDEIRKDEVPDFESNNPLTLIIGSNIPCSSQSSRVNNVRDDETGFYKGMTFKKKEELANSLKIVCLKKDFRLKKMINSSTIFSFKCSYLECNWWLRAVKFTSSDRGTHEHGYAVLNVYRYMLEVANQGSKTALSLDENGRYNIMTSNITESVNSMFDVGREFPIVALFDEINRRFALLFHEYGAGELANRFVPSIEKTYQSMSARQQVVGSSNPNYKLSCHLVIVMLLRWIYKEELVLVEFLLGQNTLSTCHGGSPSPIWCLFWKSNL